MSFHHVPKIAERIKSAGPEGFVQLVPAERSPTLAEQTLARLRSPAARRSVPPAMASRGSPPASGDEMTFGHSAAPSYSEPLLEAHEISVRRLDLQKNLTGLGNASGRPERRRTIQINLTPWCQVYLDARELARMPAETPEILGNALTQALHEERIRKGEK